MDAPILPPELVELEARLARLAPVAPPPEIWTRIERDINSRPKIKSNWLRWYMPFGAAAALVLIGAIGAWHLFIHSNSSTTAQVSPDFPSGKNTASASSSKFEVTEKVDVLLAAHNESAIAVPGQSPVIRQRETHLDSITWTDASNHATVRWVVPREEIWLTAVNDR